MNREDIIRQLNVQVGGLTPEDAALAPHGVIYIGLPITDEGREVLASGISKYLGEHVAVTGVDEHGAPIIERGNQR